ncbi:C40 family peptidase [Georgenia yuyongxinii]
MTVFAHRARRVAASVAALTLSGAVLAGPSVAAPGDGTTGGSIASLEIQLARVATQAEETTLQASVANEAYLRSEEQLAAAEAAAKEARGRAAAAAKELEAARSALGQVALAYYRDGSTALAQITPYVSARSFGEAMTRSTTLDRLGTRAETEVQRFKAVEQVAATLQRRAAEAVEVQEEATAAVTQALDEAEASVAAVQVQLSLATERRDQLIAELAAERDTTVEEERARQDRLDAERRSRQDAAARAAALQAETVSVPAPPAPASAPDTLSPAEQAPAPTTPSPAEQAPAPGTSVPAPTAQTPSPPAPTPSAPAPAPAPAPSPTPRPAPAPAPAPKPTPATRPAPVPPGQVPPVKAAAAQTAIAWARTQLGKAYALGSAGPDAYDCSGLTMRAFQQAGISLSRTSRSQYTDGTQIPLSKIEPGDLVFWSSDGTASGIYHVAIYSGGGMRIQAPNPSARVQEVPMYYVNILPTAVRL